MKINKIAFILALLLTLTVLILGYILLGIIPMSLFPLGFLGGFFLWLRFPAYVSFTAIKTPFYLSFSFFILHKLEENYMGFFPALSKITGVPVPETNSIAVYLLYIAAGLWFLIPYLIKRQNAFGYFLAWSFFTSMGVTELAHFILPFFADSTNYYFPGQATVYILAPAAWWGIYKLSNKNYTPNFNCI